MKGDSAVAFSFRRGASMEGWWAADSRQRFSKIIPNQVIFNKTISSLYVGTEAVIEVLIIVFLLYFS